MMRRRMILGIVALVCLAAGLNILVFKKDVSSPVVLSMFCVALVAGVAWVALTVAGAVRHSRHEGRGLYGLDAVVSSILFFGICVVLYAFAQHWDRSWDLTKEGRRDLAPQTVQVLQTMDKDVTLTCFFIQADDELVRIAERKTERFLAQCQKYTARLQTEVLDPQVAVARAKELGVTHASTQGTVVLRCGARQRVITLAGASPRLEERDFTNALINVLRGAEPTVYFLTGHGERDLVDTDPKEGGAMVKAVLEGESYRTEQLTIDLTAPAIPQDCDVLAINGLGLRGGSVDLPSQELQAIQAYLDRGGRVLLLLEPTEQTSGAGGYPNVLLPWLEKQYGVIVGNDVLISEESQALVNLSADMRPFDDREAVASFLGCFNNEHPVTRSFGQQMLFRLARTVRCAGKPPSGVLGTELLRTTPDFWPETDLVLLFRAGKVQRRTDEALGSYGVAVAVTARVEGAAGQEAPVRDARLIVVGNADFTSNGQFGAIPGHLNFFLNAIAWLSEREDLIAIRPSGKEDPPIILSDMEQRTIVWISVLGVLQAVVAAGVAVHLYRRKYQ